MGREIRRVPPDWEHPRQECKHSPWNGGCSDAKAHGGQCLQPLYDEDYDSAAEAWMVECDQWRAGTHREQQGEFASDTKYFWDYDGPPSEDTHRSRKWTAEEATHYQVYETVSEGTPVTPHFATQEELIDHLVAHGDAWDQSRGNGGWTRENAAQFVGRGFAVSLMVKSSPAGVVIHEPRDGDISA